ncbi:TPA: helix-turn-helix domain-containing protein [Klebsiella pneumoniae]|uniref:LysR substrate-binding domain-containing protein n=1 Tax=Klebsiella pneumoniae TaxID=573 RepID=UPI00397589FE|nr:helix-turn-helix domain-containing protein [Klebsiella pneumoniae]
MTAYGTEFFSMRDVNRLRILQDVIDRNLRPGLAAEMLGITPRHCSRLLKRYRQSGPLGMNNQSRGRTGNRLLSASLTDQALNIIRERYADFGPTLTWEKLAEKEGALESLNRYRNTPTGRIRINAAVEAANLLLAPVMPAFMDRYPDIEIDIVASNRMVDVTDAGFDAGIRYGGTVPEDMVARRLSADIRWVIAASPDYLERYGTPEHPDDLLHHRCISNRLGDDRVYRWELARDGETYQMTVPGSVTVNHAETGLVAVLGGAGLMYFPEPLVAPYVKDGRLRLVLTEWSPLEEGFHIYYSSRRQLPTGLRLLIEFIQEARPLGL